MTDLEQRESVCRLCPERRTKGVYRWCAAKDVIGGEWHDCARSRSARFSARLTLGPVTCSRWEPTTCPLCSIVDPIIDPERATPAGWRNDPAVADRHRFALDEMLSRRFDPPSGLAGDGIVYCGEGRYWPGIVIGVRLLRESGCRLPVQVWHNGPAGVGLADDPLTRLIDAREFRRAHPARILRGWEIKTYAIAHSGFRRVLYLDADAYCVADPAPAFELLDDARFAFWSDLPGTWGAIDWEWTGLAPSKVPPMQGGQFFMDVQAFWRELVVANWINQHSDYFYAHMFGDQDAMRVALSGTCGAYRCIGPAPWWRIAFICEWHGEPLVVHRCRAKLWPVGEARQNAALPLEDRVFELFAEVARGRPKPPVTPQDRRRAAVAARRV